MLNAEVVMSPKDSLEYRDQDVEKDGWLREEKLTA